MFIRSKNAHEFKEWSKIQRMFSNSKRSLKNQYITLIYNLLKILKIYSKFLWNSSHPISRIAAILAVKNAIKKGAMYLYLSWVFNFERTLRHMWRLAGQRIAIYGWNEAKNLQEVESIFISWRGESYSL